ncbi:hypothetical protein DUR17_25900, partial [Salmonella enterica subsp. enterica serovar Typhimurium]|nr:hypothetical protein [Salmonella enterica subsp. enterica serovar Typhimurium]
ELSLIEKKVLKKFFNKVDGHVSNFDLSCVLERRESKVGFMTILDKREFLKTDFTLRVYDKMPNGKIDGYEVGFVVYVEDGYVSAIEGFVYGDKWPDNSSSLEFCT